MKKGFISIPEMFLPSKLPTLRLYWFSGLDYFCNESSKNWTPTLNWINKPQTTNHSSICPAFDGQKMLPATKMVNFHIHVSILIFSSSFNYITAWLPARSWFWNRLSFEWCKGCNWKNWFFVYAVPKKYNNYLLFLWWLLLLSQTDLLWKNFLFFFKTSFSAKAVCMAQNGWS